MSPHLRAPVPAALTKDAFSTPKKSAKTLSTFLVVLGLLSPVTTPKSPSDKISLPVKFLVMISINSNCNFLLHLLI